MSTMQRIAGSTAIDAAGYDPQTRTLTLHFTRAKETVDVPDVSPEEYRAFLAAPSKGKFYHERLRYK